MLSKLDINCVEFKDLYFQKSINTKLERMNSLINMGFIGKNGLGKRTRIYCLLHKLYGIQLTKTNKRNISVKTKKGSIDIEYYRSDIHIDIDLTIYKNKRELFKEFLEPYMATISVLNNYKKIIILRNSHNFKEDILKILSIIIEKYNKNAVFIFIGNKIQNAKIKNQITLIKFPDIPDNDIRTIIKNKYKEITYKNIDKLIIKNKAFNTTNNLNNIFNLLELSIIDGEYIDFESNITEFIDELLDIIHNKKFKFTMMSKIKELLYNIYCFNYPIIDVIKYMLKNIIKKWGDNNKKYNFLHKITQKTSEISLNMLKTTKEIIHLEHFVVYYISLIYT